MRLNMLKRRRDFLAAKGRRGCNLTAAYGTKGFMLQARKRSAGEVTALRGQSGPRYGITVSKHTIRRALERKSTALKTAGQIGQKNRPKNSTNKGAGKGLRKAGGKSGPQKRGPLAVERNRMRRRLREALNIIAPKMARDGMDYVVIGRDDGLSIPFEILLKDLEKSFQKVHRRIIPSGNPPVSSRLSSNS